MAHSSPKTFGAGYLHLVPPAQTQLRSYVDARTRSRLSIIRLTRPGHGRPVPASIIGGPNIGSIALGAEARLILFRARTLNEILSRPQSDRIVLDRGNRIVDPLPDYTELD
jgi:hypothetical protein